MHAAPKRGTAETLLLATSAPLTFAPAANRGGKSRTIAAELYNSEVAASPAVVVLGEDAAVIAAFLSRIGVRAIAVARGPAGGPAAWRLARVSEAAMVADAFAALAVLNAKDGIDAAGVALIGTGAAATAATLCAYAQIARRFAVGQQRFCRHLAIAPPPLPRVVDYRTTGAPVTIWAADTPRLGQIAQDLREGGSETTVRPLPAGGERPAISANAGLLLRIDPGGQVVCERTGISLNTGAKRAFSVVRSMPLPNSLRTGEPALNAPTLNAIAQDAGFESLVRKTGDTAHPHG